MPPSELRSQPPFFSHRTRLLMARPDASDVLADISDLELGYVTNGTSFPSDVGLGSHFSVTLRSIDYGAAKPHPGMLLAAASELGILPECTIMIGDNQTEDVGAARAAGMMSVLLGQVDKGHSHRPDRAVASFGDIPDAIRALMHGSNAKESQG